MQQNLKIVSLRSDENLILVKGAVPGAKDGWVLINDAVKRARHADAPYPGAVKVTSVPEVVSEASADEVSATTENKE
jgi:large subunit ribosomal protein L3